MASINSYSNIVPKSTLQSGWYPKSTVQSPGNGNSLFANALSNVKNKQNMSVAPNMSIAPKKVPYTSIPYAPASQARPTNTAAPTSAPQRAPSTGPLSFNSFAPTQQPAPTNAPIQPAPAPVNPPIANAQSQSIDPMSVARSQYAASTSVTPQEQRLNAEIEQLRHYYGNKGSAPLAGFNIGNSAQNFQQAQMGLLNSQLGGIAQQDSMLSGQRGAALSAAQNVQGAATNQQGTYGIPSYNPLTGQFTGSGNLTTGVDVASIKSAKDAMNFIDSHSPGINNQFGAAINYARSAGLSDNVPIISGIQNAISDTAQSSAAITGFKTAVEALNKLLEGQGEPTIDPNTATQLSIAQAQETVRNNLNRKKDSYQQFINGYDENGNPKSQQQQGTTFKSPDGRQWVYTPDGRIVPFSQVGTDTKTGSGNIPQSHNNPLDIKASDFTSKFSGVKGIGKKASDGGNFLVFDTPQSGFNAAKRLITSGTYKNLSVDQALRRWSGSGYGGNIVPNMAQKRINQLSDQELDSLLQAMAHQEGYYA